MVNTWKNCAGSLTRPINYFWQKSYEDGQVPRRLKYSFILPQLKPASNKSEPSSGRPIAVTSQLIKVFECVIKNELSEYVENNNLLGHFQQGFRRGRSCLSTLMTFSEEILKPLEEGVNVESLFLDFTKAFDKVDFGVLFHG